MPKDDAPPPELDRSEHLAALHEGWETPLGDVSRVVAEVAKAPILDIQRIVAGEQNEVYDVALERAPALIVKISHKGAEGLEREAWALRRCAEHGILAPRLHALRRIEVGDGERTVLVMEKLPGERLSDLDLAEPDLRRVLGELGSWLTQLHTIRMQGWGYVDGSGAGHVATMDDWLSGSLTDVAHVFERAGRSVGLDDSTIRGWLSEILAAFEAAPPRPVLIHNDLLPNHVLVHDGHLSGVIDFGEVAAEPAACDFARWALWDGDRFPVEWIQAGYGDRSLFEGANGRLYWAVRVASGLFLMRWYHETGFLPGVEAARDRLLRVTQAF